MKPYWFVNLLILIGAASALQPQQPLLNNIMQNNKERTDDTKGEDAQTSFQSPSRNLITITRYPIRITLDTSSFSTVSAPANGANSTTASNLAFVLKAMKVAANFYMSRLQVYPLSSLQAPGLCVDYTPSINDQTYGIGASDLHIYVLYVTDKSITYGATGRSCLKYGQGGTPPDSMLQLMRPIMGRIIFNTYTLVDTQASLTNVLFQSVTATALHETLHILGFDSSLYAYWLISDANSANYGNVYTNPKIQVTVNAGRPSPTYFLTTPAVTAFAQTFFGCPSLVGMPLENQDSADPTAAGSHWQRVAMYDELMTATSMGSTIKYFSALTFAALKDMGWYTVDDTFNDTTNYGYQKGCSFVLDACFSATSFSEFCTAASMNGISACQTNFFGKAICTNTASAMADNCGIYGPYANCIDPTSTDNGYASYTFEVVSTNSGCVYSTLGTVALPNSLTSRCYPFLCNPSNITFTIGSYQITCLSTQVGMLKTLSAMTGSLTCPDFSSFCSHTRKTCPNWCSQNGYCMGGICNCLSGYYGDDCSKTMCTTQTYYSPATFTCVSDCPSGYYHNIYSHSCALCASNCVQCFGQPTICTGCISSSASPKYFYNNTCYSACPAGTFTNGFNCSLCDSTVYCAACSLTATNCTACAFDSVNNITKYLNQPGWGNCINACPVSGTYTIADVVNKVCVSTCANNLILLNNTCNYCQNNTYKVISNSSCVASCPPYYYADTFNYLCAQCDSSCLTCSGGYAQNCTSCSPTATLRYWLLNMCWAVCPGGYYPNNTDSTCHICPTASHCNNCSYSNITLVVTCTSCVSGYFFQYATSSCGTSCNSSMYGNKGSNTCNFCDFSCLTCFGPGNTFCLTCPVGSYLVQNLTGGYCISSCNPVGYVQSGSNCLACDPSCLTCSGTSSSACLSCPVSTYLSTGYCMFVCPPASYPDTPSRRCLNCDGSCTFCFGPTINNCTACVTGMVLFNFTCTLACPTGYTLNQWNVCHQPYLLVAIVWVIWTALMW